MELLRRLVAYNGWANGKVVDVCAGLEQESLEKTAPGSFGTVLDTLKHFIGTEDAYLTMLRGRDLTAISNSFEAYFAQPFAWFVHRQAELRREYDAQARDESDASLERPLTFPWLQRPLAARDAYVQVTTHSAHHRAQVFSIIGSRGVSVPDLDYVYMLDQEPS